MIVTCPACGCAINNPVIRSHETYADCLRALSMEQSLLTQRTLRVTGLAEEKISGLQKLVREQETRRSSV